MAQGSFTKDKAQDTIEAVNEMFQALPKKKQGEYLGHLEDIMLFLAAVKRAATVETE